MYWLGQRADRVSWIALRRRYAATGSVSFLSSHYGCGARWRFLPTDPSVQPRCGATPP
jgi:hypothetical protein